MEATVYAVGAYGRLATTADWNRGKDFRVVRSPPGWVGGPYFSSRDCAAIARFADRIVMVDGTKELFTIPLAAYKLG